MNKPIAWINAQDLLDMKANAIMGVKDWSLTVGLVEQKGDVPLYTIPPEQPTKIFGPNLEELLNGAGFYRKKEWVGLTEKQINSLLGDGKCWVGDDCSMPNLMYIVRLVESTLREKNK